MQWGKKVGVVGALGVVGVGVGWFVLFASVPDVAPEAVDLEALRGLADAPQSELPLAVHVEAVASGVLPRFFVVARNTPFATYPAVYASFQIVYADRTIVVDTAYDEAGWKRIDGVLSTFDPQAYARMKRGMESAAHIVVTHEHADHLTGLAAADDTLTRSRARLTPAQIAHAPDFGTGFDAERLATFSPFVYDDHIRLDAGVALAAAPGHSPGTQLIYVRLAEGKELLFVGDIVWHLDSLRRDLPRPAISSWLLREDRARLTGQVRGLRALRDTHPEVGIVVAHDADGLRDLIDRGFVRQGFVDTPAPRAAPAADAAPPP